MLAGNYPKEISDLVLPVNNHLREDESQDTLFQPANSWIPVNTNTKPHNVKQLNTIKPSRPQYIATPIIKYGVCIDNMFVLQSFTHKFCQQLANVSSSRLPTHLLKETIMLKYNHTLMGR